MEEGQSTSSGQEVVGRTGGGERTATVPCDLPRFCEVCPLPVPAQLGMDFRAELGDAEVHRTVDAVQGGDNTDQIWSPESKGSLENIISPNVENFGIPEAIEFMKA